MQSRRTNLLTRQIRSDPDNNPRCERGRGCHNLDVDALTDQITEQLHAQADAHIFRSLPRTQALRAARLLAEIGDVRGRFPTPEALASLAGVSPSTRKSGKSHVVGFRWAVDRQLRDALVEWADPTTRTLRIARQLQRRTWEHGCADPHACGARYHKIKPCPDGCKRHTRACPPPCPDDCTSHARWCPQRRGGGLVDVEVKSRAGRRAITLPAQLAVLLEDHRAAQAREREYAGTVWEEGAWMFTQPNGRPVDPTMDHNEWLKLLRDADVREARLHDARHTAATVLLLLGVPERAAMDLMGWSHGSMAKRYQHVTAGIREDIAARLDSLLWST